MNMGQVDIYIKMGIFMLILSIICRIAVGILYKVLATEAERMESTKNPIISRLRNTLLINAGRVKGHSKKRILVEESIKEIKIAGVSLRILPSVSLYCMMLAILIFGIGAYVRISKGIFLLEAFPFYISAFIAVYAYLLIASLTNYEASRELLKEELLSYLEEAEPVDFFEKESYMSENEKNRVGNLTKKSRNREREKLLKEFLS